MASGRFALRGVALAAAALAAGLAHGAISTSGVVFTAPVDMPLGPGNTDVGNNGLIIGNAAPGALSIDGGSLLRGGSLLIGPSGAGNGNGAVTIDGAGTRVELVGDGFSPGVINRLGVGEWGAGSLTVSGGAVLDGRANAAACVGINHYCGNFVANAAGSDGTFTVTGAGSQASFLRGFYVGGLAVFRPPVDAYTFGTPGGTSRGRVNVLDGGSLATDTALLGLAPGGGSPTGTERSFAEATIAGAGSVWRVTGGTLEPTAANFGTASHRNAWATLTIRDGGSLRIEGDGNSYVAVNLTTGGGRTDALVSGAGSNISFASQSGVLNVGQSLGSATLDVNDGALVDNVWYTAVGRNGSFGTLNIDGSGTLYRADGTATATANNGSDGVAVFDIGRGGGTGVVNVSNGARLEMTATDATTGAPHFSLGRDAASSGTLNISGGAVVQITAASVAPDTAGEAWNPFVRIGRDGNGTLSISSGGKLLVEGNAVSTPANTRSTNIYIGGSGSNTIGGRGVATVTGAGSEMRVSGGDAYIGVGHGPQASGQLTVSNQAAISATIMGVGTFGGTGVVRFDNASVELSGQYGGQTQQGAALAIGTGSGAVGNVSASNGTVIRISNSGSNGGGLTIGGQGSLAGGDGTLALNSASVIFDIPANNAGFTVGRSGSGLLRMSNGANVDLGGNYLFVGRQSGSDGTLIATGGSTITAGWVGVGRNLAAGGGDVDGGTATMVLNGATLFAQDVVIGTNGYLGGSNGSIQVSGSVTNYGIFSPGNSPGTFTIVGDYVAGAGSRLILEVASDGAGGFLTDLVRFDGTVDFAALNIEFRFLGDANPNLFQATGDFVIDSFLHQADGQGGWTGIAPQAFDDVQFTARADEWTFTSFSFTAEGGAVLTAVPVPEPGTYALMLAGLLVVAGRMRQRRTARR